MIIGLLGPLGCGKTTVANYLERKYGAKRYSLAGPLKRMVQNAFDLTDEQVYGTQAQKAEVDPRYNVSPRWLLQRIGTQGVRDTLGKNFWVDYLLQSANAPLVVVDDVRFKNESAGLREAGHKVWRINHPDAVVAGHASEAEWAFAPYDDAINNDGKNLHNLYAQIDALCFLNGVIVL
jgi:hypothetical protein